VRPRASLRVPLLLATCSVFVAALAAPCDAQVEAGLDASASLVKYEGYLASGAASLTPSVTWRSPRTALAARGTFLIFESGNTSIQGLISGGTFSRPVGALRLEAAAEAGASTYADFARFAHALARVRVHALGRTLGAWVGPLAGGISRGSGVGGAWGVAGGLWVRAPGRALELTGTRVAAGDTVYSDLQGRVRWQAGAVELEGITGARVASRGGGRGLYGDASISVRLMTGVALVLAGGSYASDPVRGSISGRFLTLGARLAPRPRARSAPAIQVGPFLPPDPGAATGRLDRVRVAIEQLDGLAILTVRAVGAQRVEVMGDFTDWRPIALAPAGDGGFRHALALSSGIYRFNLRLDGGPWGVPLGAGLSADEFGGQAGLLVVP